ncbi:60S ribosomal protein L21-2 [Olea europaea subsp. europaea]|uniref:60S ribosomal protein L21-2 n=1 Tax=Olea europaea subsp. europaea TaxID=158383 RepID=A0A8S0S6I8_OLEEU|nr:60S ribosomal protein L21-2 [Olea europaea subsp. europaea]
MPAPVTDAEKLIWGVLEAERPTISQLHGKSLIEANTFFLEKHRDSLMHRAAVAEMLCVLEPNKKGEAITLIERSTNDLVSTIGEAVRKWRLKDCIAVHKLLETIINDHDAASRWKVQCAEYFPYSTYFEGSCSSAVANSTSHQIPKLPENGVGIDGSISDHNSKSLSSNGKVEKLETFKDLVIQ